MIVLCNFAKYLLSEKTWKNPVFIYEESLLYECTHKYCIHTEKRYGQGN